MHRCRLSTALSVPYCWQHLQPHPIADCGLLQSQHRCNMGRCGVASCPGSPKPSGRSSKNTVSRYWCGRALPMTIRSEGILVKPHCDRQTVTCLRPHNKQAVEPVCSPQHVSMLLYLKLAVTHNSSSISVVHWTSLFDNIAGSKIHAGVSVSPQAGNSLFSNAFCLSCAGSCSASFLPRLVVWQPLHNVYVCCSTSAIAPSSLHSGLLIPQAWLYIPCTHA